ncbi:LapA family protein [Nocardia terpenica]|uniref:Lipopolysaccharide assembly protein A domain-containing protein n=1 Tax=Nocardia terpenica TaxID=455432 RepID=A0A291RXA4_9NOCA|nr:lipopolysaccharide assembly protein LapA domain-containing protein [Nocardia terpenica]ATL72143.1 hypothetical protein CRH09_27825 [Nocardia terpenica]
MTSDAVPTPGPDPAPPAETPPTPTSPTPKTPAKPTTSTGSAPTLKTRTGYTWTALVAAALLGIVVLIFILQNLEQARVHLFFWSFSLPLGATVLLSVIAGALVMALVGGWRILQLRRAAKRS